MMKKNNIKYIQHILFFTFCHQRRIILFTKTPPIAIHIATTTFEPSLMIHRMAIQWGAETMKGDRIKPKIV